MPKRDPALQWERCDSSICGHVEWIWNMDYPYQKMETTRWHPGESKPRISGRVIKGMYSPITTRERWLGVASIGKTSTCQVVEGIIWLRERKLFRLGNVAVILRNWKFLHLSGLWEPWLANFKVLNNYSTCSSHYAAIIWGLHPLMMFQDKLLWPYG